MITEEQINQHLADIDEYFAAEDYASLFKTAKTLYEETDGRYSYFLGACYNRGWGTEYDEDKALYYMENAANNDDNYLYASYVTGMKYYNKGRYVKAIEWLSSAEKAGNNDAIAYLADAAAAMALNAWETARTSRLQTSIVNSVAEVKAYLFLADEKYQQAAKTAPETMTNMLWCGYGNMQILLYNLSTSGYLNLEGTEGETLSNYLYAGLHMSTEKMNYEEHDKIFQVAIQACDFMDAHGAVVIAEYFRAFLSLMESERHQSAEAFYRAKWHMKRIEELRKNMDENEAQELSDVMSAMDEKYRAQEKKYGKAVLNMMRSGTLPDLELSYGAGLAPSVKSCKSFMKMYRQQQPSGENSKSNSKSKGTTKGKAKEAPKERKRPRSNFLTGLLAYISFSMLAIGTAATISGLFGADRLYLYMGIVGVALALLIAFLSVRGAEASQRPRYMFRFFFYGFMVFVFIMMISMIVFIPLAITFNRVMDNYCEANLVDSFGRTIGKVHVNKNLEGPDGTQYRKHSDDED